MTPLLLQKTTKKSSYRENVQHLERRLAMWQKGEIRALAAEVDAIQGRLKVSHSALDDGMLAKRFADMVFHGHVKKAMRMIVEKAKGGLPLTEVTKRDCAQKHPKAEPARPEVLLTGALPPDTHPVIFDKLTGGVVKNAIMRTNGAAGISQMDDNAWRKMASSFKDTSTMLCNSVAVRPVCLRNVWIQSALKLL